MDWIAGIQRLGYRLGDFVQRLRNGITISNARYQRLVDLVSVEGAAYSKLSDAELRVRASLIRDQVLSGVASLDAVSVAALASRTSTVLRRIAQ